MKRRSHKRRLYASLRDSFPTNAILAKALARMFEIQMERAMTEALRFPSEFIGMVGESIVTAMERELNA